MPFTSRVPSAVVHLAATLTSAAGKDEGRSQWHGPRGSRSDAMRRCPSGSDEATISERSRVSVSPVKPAPHLPPLGAGSEAGEDTASRPALCRSIHPIRRGCNVVETLDLALVEGQLTAAIRC